MLSAAANRIGRQHRSLNRGGVHMVRTETAGHTFLLWLTLLLLTLTCFCQSRGYCETWTDVTIRLLGDSSFAMVELDENGNRIKHCPHHDINGVLDMNQVIYCLGTLEMESWLSPDSRKAAQKHLMKHYKKFTADMRKKIIPEEVDMNSASLSRLVSLPNIGPVLAVRIVKYRETVAIFFTPEDIMKVQGVSRGTFQAIRHYVKVQ